MIIPTHYVASSPGVQLHLAGFKRISFWKRMLSNTSLFYMIAKGEGAIALQSCGQLQQQEIAPDTPLRVDNEHIVAWTTGLTVTPGLAVQNTGGTKKRGLFRRAFSSLMSGEGIVMTFSGTGTVFFQTRLDRILRLEKRMARLEGRQALAAAS